MSAQNFQFILSQERNILNTIIVYVRNLFSFISMYIKNSNNKSEQRIKTIEKEQIQ